MKSSAVVCLTGFTHYFSFSISSPSDGQLLREMPHEGGSLRRVLILAIVLSIALAGCSNDTTAPQAVAPSCVDYGDAPHWVNSTGFDTYAVAVSGSYLFSTSGSEFDVFRIGSDRIPEKMASFGLSQGAYRYFARKFALSNSYVYTSGLEVIHVSNPQAPLLTGRVDLHTFIGDVAVSGSNAYVFSDADDGIETANFYVVDVSDPSAPAIRGSLQWAGVSELRYGGSVWADSRLALAADGTALTMIDVSTPDAPRVLNRMSIPANDIAVAGSYTFAVTDGALLILDVRSPGALRQVASLPDGGGQAVTLGGSLAYVAYGRLWGMGSGLKIIDVKNPKAPRLLANVGLAGGPLGVAVHNDAAYVATYCNLPDPCEGFWPGLQTVALGARQAPPAPGVLNMQMVPVASNGDIVFAVGNGTNQNSTLYALDSDFTGDIVVRGSLALSSIGSVAVTGTTAYVTTPEGVQIIDASRPDHLQIAGLMPGVVGRFAVAGDHGFILNKREVQGIDVSHPLAPVLGGKVYLKFEPENLALSSTRACMATYYGNLAVINISKSEDPLIQFQEIDWNYISTMAIENDILYAFSSHYGSYLGAYDISIDWPRGLGHVDLPGGNGSLTAADGYLYGAGGEIFDIRNFGAPRLVGVMPVSGAIAIADGKVFAGSWDGLRVMPAQCPH
jgi:hypothetical protein